MLIMTTKFAELKRRVRDAPFLNSDELEEILVEFAPHFSGSKALKYLNDNWIFHKIGNKKIGIDTVIINVNSVLNCYCGKTGLCDEFGRCYAQAVGNLRLKSDLTGIESAIMFDRLTVDEIIEQVEETIINAKDDDIKFIRFNELGEFDCVETFLKANEVAKYFFEKYGIISYSYTHNSEIPPELLIDSYIVMTFSYPIGMDEVKKAIVVDGEEIMDYVGDDEYIICTGSCYHCPYCKDRNDTRTVVFINHYQKNMEKELKKYLGEELFNRLVAIKFIDYGNYLLGML